MQPLLVLIGLLAGLASAQEDYRQPVVIKLQPQPYAPKFLKQLPAPKAVAPSANVVPQQVQPTPQQVTPGPVEQPRVQGVLNQAVLPPAPSVPSAQQPVFQLGGSPPGTQKFVPRPHAVVASPPPVTIAPDVQNQLIKFFGLDTFGIPGLTGNHPNGIAGALQELRAAGIPVNGMPQQGNAQAQGVTTQQDVLSQANPNFQDQLSQLNREVQNPGPYKSGGSIPLPADQPGENGLIGLLSTSIRKLVKDTGVGDALSNSLPSILGSQTQIAGSSTGAKASGVPSVSASQDDAPVTTHVSGENIRRKPSSPAQGVLQTIASALGGGGGKNSPTHVGLPRIPGIQLLPGGIPRNSQGQIDVVNLIDGGLTKNDKTATFTALKIYREGSEFGPVKYSVGYAFRAGNKDAMLSLHSSETNEAQPFWIYKLGPEGKDPFGNPQYEYAIVSNWVKYPVTVLVRDPDTFKAKYQKEVLIWLEKEGFVNGFIRAFNLLQPASYTSCQYADSTFEVFGKK